jgi:hypothetical protein
LKRRGVIEGVPFGRDDDAGVGRVSGPSEDMAGNDALLKPREAGESSLTIYAGEEVTVHELMRRILAET